MSISNGGSGRRFLRGPQVWDSVSDLERIVFFSDAVIAIAITLLVFQLAVPRVPAGHLTSSLRDLGSHFFTFALSFFVIGQFWMAHHRIYRYIVRYDLGLLWLNLLYLLLVAFLPFPTALLGNYFGSGVAGLFYGLSLFATSIAGSAIWFYASGRGLIDDLPDDARRTINSRSIATPFVFLLGAFAALIDVYLGVLCWAVLLPLTRTFFTLHHVEPTA